MAQDDFERYRKRLEAQLHADIGLLYEAFHSKLRAYQTIERSRRGELDLDPDLQLAAGGSPLLPSAAVPTPSPAPAPAAPPPRREPEAVIDAIREVLPRLAGDFDSYDVLQALGFEPRRSTFYEALNQLLREGVIERVREAGGKRGAQYRIVAAAS